MSGLDDAREAGANALAGLRDRLALRAASLVKAHPDFAAGAAEIGLVDRAWLDDPSNRPIRTATTVDVVKRFLERSIEQEPSLIAAVGLNAIELLTLEAETGADGATAYEMTIVFTDLEGFTSYTRDHGDAAARTLLDHHHRSLGPIIRSRGGRIVKRLGDGLLVSFNAPEAAVLAALEVQAADHGPLRLRAGIHHGEAVLLRDDLIGHDVNLAARVTDSARGGETLATTAVREAVGELPGVRFGRARRRRFKGVDETVLVCPVTAE